MRDAAIDDALMVADRLVSVRSRQLMIESGITIVAIILLIGGGVFFLLRVVSPLGSMTGTMTRIAEGEAAEIGYAGRKDEIGEKNGRAACRVRVWQSV